MIKLYCLRGLTGLRGSRLGVKLLLVPNAKIERFQASFRHSIPAIREFNSAKELDPTPKNQNASEISMEISKSGDKSAEKSTNRSSGSEKSSESRLEDTGMIRSSNPMALTAKLPKISITAQPSLRRLNRPEPQDRVVQSYKPCTAISTCERYDLAKVVECFYSQGFRSAHILLPQEVAHVKYPFNPGQTADVLVLANGTIVAWGMTEAEVTEHLIPLLKPSEIRSYKSPESEDMDYIEDQQVVSEETAQGESDSKVQQLVNSSSSSLSRSTMIGDVIYISGPNQEKNLLDKAAFSSGLARNTKLAALEISLENYIVSTKQFTDNLATGQSLGLKGRDVLKITGRLLQIRGQLNLYSELIETPDLYWSEPELEELYSLISRKLDITPRIAILNKKLDYASEIASILKAHISEQQGIRLEWMIIILIMVEVAFEITHSVERYLEKAPVKKVNQNINSQEDI